MSDTTSPEGNRKPDHEPDSVDHTDHTERTDAPDYTGTGSHAGSADYSDSAEPTASFPARPVGEPISYDAPAAQDAREPNELNDAEKREADKRDAYVPAATVAPAANTTAETQRLEPVANRSETANATYAPANTTVTPPVYIQAPTPPKYKSNRGVGLLIALLSTGIFAVLYSLIAFALSGIGSLSLSDTAAKFTDFIVLPIFYVPVIFFFVAFALLVLLVNRGGWWAYVLFGFLVAVVVYFSYIGAALLSVQAWLFTPDEAARFISQQWLNPGAIAAAVVAREVPIWAGAWIARNGRSVTTRNAATKAEYDRVLAEGPQGIRSN
ncbi:hypothetical protein E3T26_07375 [Cryobacterium sp. TMT1-21]|uniref:Uncharacterized protein n=1 Tax=Cryobacterium shii TaxID=1259235 RepID=A0AAQ2HFK6_9MICO|nr:MULTISPECIES: tripartite tricarboxylate transporter TctB family protein [Cryobacterium]TFC47057.1 hypothetical protein E3O49_08690 [Cryobacterium shii]TFD13172.1 hypothetical protein E3T42_14125 [Cryobacterium sp. TMT4-10]TFD15311.1 hypothetical protein E3T26_07375 [Cryobacterium sp. TMT1-21]